jgi:arylsulfatase A-like enzyme
MGLADNTAIIFTSDHGFYFGEHGGRFGKMTFGKRPDGRLYAHGDPDSQWDFSPLYEEVSAIPLLVHVPGTAPGVAAPLTAAVDVMPTVLDIVDTEIPNWVDGRSLLPAIRGSSRFQGREFAVSTVPFANPGDRVSSVDNISRPLTAGIVTTITSAEWSLLYSVDAGTSELYYLPSDPNQLNNVIAANENTAREHHRMLVRFMKETNLPESLITPRMELRL